MSTTGWFDDSVVEVVVIVVVCRVASAMGDNVDA